MSRVELRDGQWAELRERINHGLDKHIKKASLRARPAFEQGDLGSDEVFDWPTTMVGAFVRTWNVRDEETGQPIQVGAFDDPTWVNQAPEDIIDVLFTAATAAWTRATVPNGATPPSSDA